MRGTRALIELSGDRLTLLRDQSESTLLGVYLFHSCPGVRRRAVRGYSVHYHAESIITLKTAC